MRNLKKILALVLALIMSLSLMATASAGSFQDVTDDNPYKTAIDVLDELKVFQGYKEDGTFRPTETLNRAQAAVLVYRVATGDVEDKYVENYTYMAQSKFNDLDGYNWAKGYINYCQNAKIVVGTSATTFSPEAPVTGYQLMVMLLRTLGYGAAGEFTDPKGWELETAKIAEREGLLKNVTGGDFGNPAPRQMVAEILFRGLLHDTVQYSPLTPNGYTESGEILGKRVGLEEVTGVVVANEWANLEGSKPLAEGKTILKVDGKNRTIDVSTSGADLGTSVHAYLKGATVLTDVEDAGNDIRTNEGAETTVKNLKGDLDIDATTEYFVNYGPQTRDDSDWRLEYVVVEKMSQREAAALVRDNGGAAFLDNGAGTNADNLTMDADEKASLIDSKNAATLADSGDKTEVPYTYNKSIPAGQDLTGTDKDYMETIFKYSDSFNDDAYQGHDVMNGEVYAATKSGKYDADKSYDVSDDLSWKQFCEKYLNLDANDSISGADQGESLRIIDNDGDGVADYVLRVDFVMTTIVDYDKRTDTYFVEYDEDETKDKDSSIKASDIKGIDGDVDLSTDAIILYSLIDGVYYTKNPEVYTATIDKKGIDTKNATFTVDGEDHIWSGIDKEAQHYYKELKELVEGVKYDFHLDYFGNARLANEATKGFVLLTDAYYWSNRHQSTTQVELYDVAQEKLVEVDAKDYADDFFVDRLQNHAADYPNIDDSWLRLNTFGTTYPKTDTVGTQVYKHYEISASNPNNHTTISKDPFRTNIAAYTESDGVYSLADVTATNILTTKRQYNTYEIAGTKEGTACSLAKAGSVSAKDQTLYGIATWKNAKEINTVQRVMTTASTTYYYVDWNSKGQIDTVETWTGYSNVPESLGDFQAIRAYAVTYKSDSVSNYDVAEVVVFEGAYEKPVYDAWLVYAARNDTRYEYSLGLQDDGSYGDGLTDLGVFKGRNVKSIDTPDGILEFYDKDGKVITEDYAKYGVYVGTINTRRNVNYRDYITFGDGQTVREILTSEDMFISRFVIDTDRLNSEINAVDADDYSYLKDGHKVIYMLNAKGEVALVANLDDTVDQNGKKLALDDVTALKGLYNDIHADQVRSASDWITKITVQQKVSDVVTILDSSLVTLAPEDTKITTDKGFKLNFVTTATITAVEPSSGYAVKVGSDWFLYGASGNVTLTVTVAAATYSNNIILAAGSTTSNEVLAANVTGTYVVDGVEKSVAFGDGSEKVIPGNTVVTIKVREVGQGLLNWVVTETINNTTTAKELTKGTDSKGVYYTFTTVISHENGKDTTLTFDVEDANKKSDAKELTALKIKGVAVKFNGTTGTVGMSSALMSSEERLPLWSDEKVSDGAKVKYVLHGDDLTNVTDSNYIVLAKNDVIVVTVEAEDGSTKDYTITVAELDDGTAISTADTSIIVDNTDDQETIYVNYTQWNGKKTEDLTKKLSVADGKGSLEFNVDTVNNNTRITAVAEDGTTEVVYAVEFTRKITLESGTDSTNGNKVYITQFECTDDKSQATGTENPTTFVIPVTATAVTCTLQTDGSPNYTAAAVNGSATVSVNSGTQNQLDVAQGTADISVTVTATK